jgi:hypothetical protein
MCALRRIVRDFDVLLNNIQLRALFMHHVCHIAKQLVQFANTLLDVAYLRLALDDERLLEVDFILVCQPQLFLLLLLAEIAGRTLLARRLRIERGAGGLCRGLFLVERGFLELLEFLQGGAELALELGLRELLRGLLRVSHFPTLYETRLQHTPTSGHVVIFLTPSPISLNVSEVSSTVVFTRSRTRAVSCFVPSLATSVDRRATLRVRAKRSSESLLANSRNSGSSAYSGSSLRRKLVGCASRADERWKDMARWGWLR